MKKTPRDEERIRRLLRRIGTGVNNKYGIGGIEKTRWRPKPVTLAKLGGSKATGKQVTRR